MKIKTILTTIVSPCLTTADPSATEIEPTDIETGLKELSPLRPSGLKPC